MLKIKDGNLTNKKNVVSNYTEIVISQFGQYAEV